MVIISEDDQQTPKSQQRDVEAAVEPQPIQAPPAYEAGSYQAGTSSAQPLYAAPLHQPQLGEPAGKRFFKAFVIAVLIWALLGAVTSSIAEVGRQAGTIERELKYADTARPRVEDGKVLECVKGANRWRWDGGRRSVSFELPRTADVLYLFQRGLMTSGNVIIIQDERIHEPDTLHIDVVAQHDSPSYLHAISVCAMERKSGEQGIGIFTPTQWWSRRGSKFPELAFEVTLRLPKVSYSDPLYVNTLETNMPNFEQHIGDLKDSVYFQYLSLVGSNGHIYSQSVTASHARIKTSNAHIRGRFESREVLLLETTNSIIEAEISLVNMESESSAHVEMKSTNGRVNSTVILRSQSGHGGTFTVGGASTNGRMSLDVLALPIDAALHLYANTTNAPAAVSVPSTFEGYFDVETTNGKATVSSPSGTDPSGRGRSRNYNEYGSTSHRWGMTEWEEEHISPIPATIPSGSIVMRTKNAPATLSL